MRCYWDIRNSRFVSRILQSTFRAPSSILLHLVPKCNCPQCRKYRAASLATLFRREVPPTRQTTRVVYFLRNEQPSVRRALPPVGWHSTCEQPAQTTTVWACEKTVVMVKQPGHLTSMKNERGAGTKVFSLCFFSSAWGVGLRRSTARTILMDCPVCVCVERRTVTLFEMD